MAGFIPKEQLAAYTRWEATAFDAPARPLAATPPPEAEPSPVAATPPDEGEVVSAFALPTAEDIERIHNEAQQSGYEAGFSEGREAGYQEGQASARAEGERLNEVFAAVTRALGELDQSVADQLLELSLEIARQVLMGTLAARKEALLPVVREAIAALPLHHGHIQLMLNPEDAPLVREIMGEQLQHSGAHIIEDRELAAGGCLIRAGSSEIDASLATRWKRVVEAISGQPDEWLP